MLRGSELRGCLGLIGCSETSSCWHRRKSRWLWNDKTNIYYIIKAPRNHLACFTFLCRLHVPHFHQKLIWPWKMEMKATLKIVLVVKIYENIWLHQKLLALLRQQTIHFGHKCQMDSHLSMKFRQVLLINTTGSTVYYSWMLLIRIYLWCYLCGSIYLVFINKLKG